MIEPLKLEMELKGHSSSGLTNISYYREPTLKEIADKLNEVIKVLNGSQDHSHIPN